MPYNRYQPLCRRRSAWFHGFTSVSSLAPAGSGVCTLTLCKNNMAHEYPPELKSFHARTFLHIIPVFMIPVIAGAWAFYRQESYSADDDLQTALSWVFMLGIAAFMITILYRALVALPKCPTCHRKMTQLQTVNITERTVFNLKSSSRWRIVECRECNNQYRIPGLSSD